MKTTSSPWRAHAPASPATTPGALPKNSDIVIVGAGITGLTAAYLLAKAGKSVIVLDKGQVGSGETGQTTAFLSYVTDSDLTELAAIHGKDKAKEVWQSLRSAIDTIEGIVTAEHIDCEFTRCPLTVFSLHDTAHLTKEFESAKSFGFPVTLKKEGCTVPHAKSEVVYAENAKFHPLRYLNALKEKSIAIGVQIYEHTEVVSYGRTGDRVVVATAQEAIQATDVIIATHSPNILALEITSRLIPHQTYVFAATFPAGCPLPNGLYIDTADPYHYIRIDGEGQEKRLLMGGGDHITGKTPDGDPYQRLDAYLKELLPGTPYTITHRWSGQVIESVDGLPFIASAIAPSNHISMSGGFAGDGLTFGTLAAMITTDRIIGRKNAWAALYTTNRYHGLKKFIEHNVDTAISFIQGRIRPSGSTAESLQPDSGAVITENGKKIAAYKDHAGNVQKLSAVCTHMNCIVNWNKGEKTWDCPCHGSRFEKDGRVLNGPATKPLPKVE